MLLLLGWRHLEFNESGERDFVRVFSICIRCSVSRVLAELGDVHCGADCDLHDFVESAEGAAYEEDYLGD